jgi:MFS family permease
LLSITRDLNSPLSYKRYMLLVLTVILAFNSVDRIALGVILQDIKIDLALSDTQLGVLTGIAFAMFYSVMGIPIARWADRGNRVSIISLTTFLWSGAVALCGLAGNFVQLLLIRVGVGVGEAGCIPPALSLIAEYYNRAERPRAAAIYGMGGALSFVVGFFMSGWLDHLYGWRVTFVLVALPGLVLAALARFSLREPRRTKSTDGPSSVENSTASMAREIQPTLPEVAATLWANKTFRNLLLCLSVVYLFGYGILQWQPTFFIRSYGFTTGKIGTWLAVTYGAGGLLGTWLGGELASRFAANNERLQLKGMALALVGSGIAAMFVYLTSDPYLALVLIGFYVLCTYAINGPLLATIQTLIPSRMRAVSIALVYLVANLIGMGLGPVAVGVASDLMRPWAAEESLRYALMMLGPGYFLGAWYAWRASRTVAADLEKRSEHDDASDNTERTASGEALMGNPVL